MGNVLQNAANNTTGTITYEYTLTNPSGQASGNGTVATVPFHAIAAGNANIQWTTGQFTDNASASSASSSSTAAVLMVGQAVPTSTPTPTGTATSSPTSTNTPAPTDTPVPGATYTDTPAATETPGATTPTRSPSPAPTPPASSTPAATNTAGATATPRVTVIDNSNKAKPPQSGVDPAAKSPGLPSAGNSGPGIQWWRWIFFLAALMLAIAGWFFTFAIHYGDEEPIVVDRGDRRRRRRY